MKLSNNQLFWMIFCFQVHYALNPAFQYGHQDAWIISLVMGIAVMLLTFIIVKASLLSRDESLPALCRRLFGKWLGSGAAFFYIASWFLLTAVTLREWADYVFLKLLPNTPVFMVLIPFLLLVVYVNVKGGIMAIGYCSQVIGPLYFLISFVPFFLMFGVMEWSNLLPIYTDTGGENVLRGAIPALADVMGGSMVPFIIMGKHTDSKKTMKSALWAMGLSALWVILSTIGSVLVVGPHQASELIIPWVDSIRTISILDFIQNVDAFAICIYAFAHFISVSASMFGTSYGLAEWVGAKNWKRIVWYVAISVFLCVILTSNLGHITNDYRQSILVPWILPLNMLMIPILLLLMDRVKRWHA
ncbi:GerAB/ArcD/ProY family transporter [Paenibacillus albus]|uniref:Uncharacterized protein n=1 Tax=Paenibacillus albus TaxID=2495582 RepID=A0A3S9A7N6_9BACL|nr:endospore germination permease [Paenibacillus albus]AZN41636.1 hypothetical protein EJC50_19620 [Paenibacillus albus]